MGNRGIVLLFCITLCHGSAITEYRADAAELIGDTTETSLPSNEALRNSTESVEKIISTEDETETNKDQVDNSETVVSDALPEAEETDEVSVEDDDDDGSETDDGMGPSGSGGVRTDHRNRNVSSEVEFNNIENTEVKRRMDSDTGDAKLEEGDPIGNLGRKDSSSDGIEYKDSGDSSVIEQLDSCVGDCKAGQDGKESWELLQDDDVHDEEESLLSEEEVIVLNRDNLLPLMKAVMLAYTHKESPSYFELVEAAGVSALKTISKMYGKEKLGRDLLHAVEKLKTKFLFEEDMKKQSMDEYSEILGYLAEKYLSKHRISVMLPQSLLLDDEEMKMFLARKEKSQVEGRSLPSGTEKEFEVIMPRTDSTGVSTLFSIGPMGWMIAAIGGLFSIPYFFSSPVARKDTHLPALVRPPGPFGHGRREEEVPHFYQHLRQGRPHQQQFEFDGWHWIWQNGEYVWQPIAPPHHPDLQVAHSVGHASHTQTGAQPVIAAPTEPPEHQWNQAQQQRLELEPRLQPPPVLQQQQHLQQQPTQQQPQPQPQHQALQQQQQQEQEQGLQQQNESPQQQTPQEQRQFQAHSVHLRKPVLQKPVVEATDSKVPARQIPKNPALAHRPPVTQESRPKTLVQQRLVQPTPVRRVVPGRRPFARKPVVQARPGNTDSRRSQPFGQPRHQTQPGRQPVRLQKLPQHQKQRPPNLFSPPPPRRQTKPNTHQKHKVKLVGGRGRPPVRTVGLQRPTSPSLGGQTGDTSSAAAGSLSPISPADSPVTFGTFRPVREGNTHFTVFQLDTNDQVRPPTLPSPDVTGHPNDEPSTISPPKAETGFKPIIPTEPPAPKVTVPSPVLPSHDGGVKPFRKETALTTQPTNSGVPKKISTGFKPIKTESEERPEVTTQKISQVTSSVFKTSTTPSPRAVALQKLRYTSPRPPTSPPAFSVRTSTSKSVRVVTSTSVLYPGDKVPVNIDSSELRKPHQHQHVQPEQDILLTSESVVSPAVVKQHVPSLPPFGAKLKQPIPSVPSSSSAIQSGRPTGSSVPGVTAKLVAPLVPSTGTLTHDVTTKNIIPVKQNTGVSIATAGAPESAPTPEATVHHAAPAFVYTNIPTDVRVIDHSSRQAVPPHASAKTPSPRPSPTPMPIYALDPFYGPRLSRIDAIFHQVNVHEEGCRMQLVCNIYKNPSAYTPVSDFLSRQLTVRLEDLTRPKTSDEALLRYFRYLKAAKNGQDDDVCNDVYSNCSQDTTLLTHKPIMNAYRTVSLLMDNRSS